MSDRWYGCEILVCICINNMMLSSFYSLSGEEKGLKSAMTGFRSLRAESGLPKVGGAITVVGDNSTFPIKSSTA